MEHGDLVDGWVVSQQRRALSPNTVTHRRTAVRAFARWLAPRGLVQAARQDIDGFLDERALRPQSRRVWISDLSSFYGWAVAEGFLDESPTAQILRPRTPRRLPRPAPSATLAPALAAAPQPLRSWIVLAAYQGLRCQEIAGLEREDIVDESGLLRVVHGKGARERLLPLHPLVLETLMTLPLPRGGPLFPSQRRPSLSPAALSNAFNRGLREFEVGATAHQLRHWFGTNLYAATHDLRLTQEMLGHASPATTAIYAAFDPYAARHAVAALTFDGESQ